MKDELMKKQKEPLKNYRVFVKEIVAEIARVRFKAYQTVNKQLVELYWFIGNNIYEKVEIAKWGEGIVEKLSLDLQREFAGIKGFSKENLWRMKRIYEVYRNNPKLSTLLTELKIN